MEQLTGNPLFPYFNDYCHSPLALHRALSRHALPADPFLARSCCFPSCSRWTGMSPTIWAFRTSASASPMSLVIAAHRRLAACGAQSRDPLIDKRVTLPFCSPSPPSPISSGCKMFAIYRYIILLEMLAPLLIVAARSACCRCRGAQPLSGAGALCFAVPGDRTQRFLERAPLDDPYVQVALPPIPHPEQTMVLMTGDAPHGLHRTVLAAPDSGAANRRLDGAAAATAPRITRQMKRRVGGHLARRRRPLPDRRRHRHGPGARRPGRLWPCHPLDGMPAIRHQHHRHLSMVSAVREKPCQ